MILGDEANVAGAFGRSGHTPTLTTGGAVMANGKKESK
jgi:hypothetical protein